MNKFFDFSHYINENAVLLANEVLEKVMNQVQFTLTSEERSRRIDMFSKLFVFLGEAPTGKENKQTVADLLQWSKRNAAIQADSGKSVLEIAKRYPATRAAFTDVITRISLVVGLQVQENALLIKQLNHMLDLSLNEMLFTFEELSEAYKNKTQKELAELSAPIVPVKNGVVVMPFIGEIDQYRSNHIMEKVVPKLADLDVDYVIADFSGILTINAETAEYLHQISSMLKLMGIQVMITGLRTELAQTIVSSRISLADIASFATVKQALQTIKD